MPEQQPNTDCHTLKSVGSLLSKMAGIHRYIHVLYLEFANFDTYGLFIESFYTSIALVLYILLYNKLSFVVLVALFPESNSEVFRTKTNVDKCKVIHLEDASYILGEEQAGKSLVERDLDVLVDHRFKMVNLKNENQCNL